MIVFPANVLVCGELVNLKVELEDSSLLEGYDGVGLIIESLNYKMESSSRSTSNSSSLSSVTSMHRLKSVESLSSVTLNTMAEISYSNATSLPICPTNTNTSATTPSAMTPLISPSTSFSSIMAATMIDSIVKNTTSTASASALQLSFRIDPEAVSESPGALATLSLQVSLTAKRGDRIERLRTFEGSVSVIRALAVSFLRRAGLIQLVLCSGPKEVEVKHVALKGCQLMDPERQFMVPERSSHGLVFKGSQSLLNVQVEAVIDDRPVSLSFESSCNESEPEETSNSPVQFTFKRLPQTEDDCLLLQFQLQLFKAADITIHYSQTSSIVPFSRSSRLISVPPCGIVQWTERFKRITQDSVKLMLTVSDTQSDSFLFERAIIL